MNIQLYDYQLSIYDQIVSGNTDDVIQLDTGGGKTPILTKLAVLKNSIIIVHRDFLVEQVSRTLTKQGDGVPHQIIASPLITKRCQLFQRNNNVEYGGTVWIATIQSLISRFKRGRLKLDISLIEWVLIDETHHVAKDNIWAQLKDIFSDPLLVNQVRYIGATATPCRLDGKGLHKDCGGLFDRLVQAEQLKENSTQRLIAMGRLSDYDYWCPETNGIDFSKLKIKDGEFTDASLNEAMRDPILIAGSVIKEYKRLADGKRNLVYCGRVELAKLVAKRFRQSGYTASYIASSLSNAENMRRVDAFKSGELLVLVNVEMVTEGFDLPEIECVQKLRLTRSFTLNRQMDGRNSRPKPNGNKAIYIDHVGNALLHGLPCDAVEWTLYGTPKNKSEPVIDCAACGFVHNAYLAHCPNCGFENWLKSLDAEENPKVLAELVDVALVKKVRAYLLDLEIKAQQEKLQAEYEHLLNTVIQIPKWQYNSSVIGQLCKKLSIWFAENIAQTDMDIRTVNDFLLGSEPELRFWSSNFTIKDLDTNNPEKCKKVLEKWLSN